MRYHIVIYTVPNPSTSTEQIPFVDEEFDSDKPPMDVGIAADQFVDRMKEGGIL